MADTALATAQKKRHTTFADMLAPLRPEEFIGQFYERKHCLVQRQDPGFYRHLLSFKGISDLLASQVLRYPQAKLVNRALAEPVKPEAYTTNGTVIHPAHFLKHYAEGCTVALSGLQEHLPELGALCDQLSKAFSQPFQTNIYLTPPNAQGFHPHYDTHDVFILQIEGSKLWRLFDTPLQLPMRTQPFELNKVAPGPISSEFTLHAGDMLYIPRGLMHDAEATDDLSLHVTVGLLGYTWQDLLVETILHMAQEDVAYRRNLPVGYAHHGYGGHANQYFQDLLGRVQQRISVKESFDRFADKLQNDMWPNLHDQLEQVASLGRITLDSVVEKREALWYRRTTLNDKCQVHVYGRVIELPVFMAEAIDHMDGATGPFRVGDLPDCVDAQGKIVFVQRMVKEGILRTAPLEPVL